MSVFAGVLTPKLNEQGPRHYQPRRLFSIVRELPSSEIYFDVDTKNFASIRSDSSYFKILGLPEEEFPPLARFDDAKIFTIAQKDLKDGLKKTSYAISAEQTRYCQETEIIVPTKAVTEIQRLVREEGEGKLSIGENQIAFELHRTLLVAKLIEGNYPNYRQVIPPEAKERITLERETFLTAVRRVSLLASEKSNSVNLIFAKGNIDIVATTPEA
jgi:DNA polymerase-3 subunit beta